MVDIHSHILPGIDDGAVDKQMTLNMLKIAENDGISTMVATPHYFSPHYIATQKEVNQKVANINKLAKENEVNVEVLPGREIMLGNYTLENIKQGVIGSLDDTQYLLVEFSMSRWNREYLDIIYELQLMGYNIILAHPERYHYIQDDITMLNPLIKEGVILQLNVGSILGEWGIRVQRVAKELVRQGVFKLIGSDAHSDTFRTPALQEGLDRVKKIDPYTEKQMREYPYEILNEKAINPDKVYVYKRTIFGLLNKFQGGIK